MLLGGPVEAEEHDPELFSGPVPIAVPFRQFEPTGDQYWCGCKRKPRQDNLEAAELDSELGRSHTYPSNPNLEPDSVYFALWLAAASTSLAFGSSCGGGLVVSSLLIL